MFLPQAKKPSHYTEDPILKCVAVGTCTYVQFMYMYMYTCSAVCEFFTFLDSFRLTSGLAHEILCGKTEYIMVIQLILMVGNAKYAKQCEKQIFVKYRFNNF